MRLHTRFKQDLNHAMEVQKAELLPASIGFDQGVTGFLVVGQESSAGIPRSLGWGLAAFTQNRVNNHPVSTKGSEVLRGS